VAKLDGIAKKPESVDRISGLSMLDKTFNPRDVEARISALWRASGAFSPGRPGADPFSVVIPPPNVTGRLHIGHALNNVAGYSGPF
jgi:isoleucyl-tRNA synthetase